MLWQHCTWTGMCNLRKSAWGRRQQSDCCVQVWRCVPVCGQGKCGTGNLMCMTAWAMWVNHRTHRPLFVMLCWAGRLEGACNGHDVKGGCGGNAGHGGKGVPRGSI